MAGHFNYYTIPPITGMIAKATHTRVNKVHSFDLIIIWVNSDLELCMGLYHSDFELTPWEEDRLNECITKGELSVGAPWVIDSSSISLICGSLD